MRDWFPKQTLGALPARARSLWPEREALVFEGRRWTFHALDAEVNRVAKGLLALGVSPGDKVAVWMTNRPEWLFTMFAIAKVGAVLVPLNTRYRTRDVGYALRQSDASTLITLGRSGPIDFAGMLREAIPELGRTPLAARDFPELARVILLDDAGRREPGMLPFQELLERGARITDGALRERADAVDPDGLAVIAYTSGTTGDPKGAMHDHAAVRNVSDCANRLGITFVDVILNYLPLFHLYAFSSSAMMSLISGAKQVLVDGFVPERCLDLIAQERVSILHGFDTHYRDLMLAQEAQARDLSSLRLATFPAGSEASWPIASRMQSALCPSVSGYGMTEVWTFSALSFPGSSEAQRLGASGFPSPGYEFRIVDPETGLEQPAGVPGEILMRGYMVTRGYYRKPEATAQALDEAGFFHSGDTGLMRADGHLQFLGRYKDMLKVGGENVSPAEVEGYLLGHASVLQVAVVGAPDARLSEVPVAFVVARPGCTLSPEELLGCCRGKIASFKIPKHVWFVEALPETPTGKVQKHKLREQAARLLG